MQERQEVRMNDEKIMANGGLPHEGEFFGLFSYIAAE